MKELREIREEAFHRFYLRPMHILRIFSKGGMYGFSLTKTALAHFLRAIKSKF
jgi:hypothetical protein